MKTSLGGAWQRWDSGTPSSVEDPTDPSRSEGEDLTRVSIRQADATHIRCRWESRGDIPMDVSWGELHCAFVLDDAGTGEVHENWELWLNPEENGWEWAMESEGVSFLWRSADHEDIVSVRVNQLAGGEIQLEMTLASDVPASPGYTEAEPWFVWWFGADNDLNTGSWWGDVLVAVRYDRDSSNWEAAIQKRNGRYFADTSAQVRHEISGKRVRAVAKISDRALSLTFLWYSGASVKVGPTGEKFQDSADFAPDDTWVEMSLVQRVYLPLWFGTQTGRLTSRWPKVGNQGCLDRACGWLWPFRFSMHTNSATSSPWQTASSKNRNF